MDIYCTKCGEPWDLDTLHEEVAHRERCKGTVSIPQGDAYGKLFDAVRTDFAGRGCVSLTCMNMGECTPGDDEAKNRADISSALHDLMGDDIDGIAAMMEDHL